MKSESMDDLLEVSYFYLPPELVTLLQRDPAISAMRARSHGLGSAILISGDTPASLRTSGTQDSTPELFDRTLSDPTFLSELSGLLSKLRSDGGLTRLGTHAEVSHGRLSGGNRFLVLVVPVDVLRRTGGEELLTRLNAGEKDSLLVTSARKPEKKPTPVANAVTRPSVSEVAVALRHLADFDHLGSLALAHMKIVRRSTESQEFATRIGRGRALREVIAAAIEEFRPPTSRPERGYPPEWQPYLILRLAYVEGQRHRDVMAELYISEGTFNRRRRSAIRALTNLLSEWEMAEVGGSNDRMAT